VPNLASRSYETEVMDDLNSSGQIIDVTLRELEIINKLLGGNYVTINGIITLLKNIPNEQSVTLADVGCGSGDILRLIRKKLNALKRNAVLIGIDANPNIAAYATLHTSADFQIVFKSIDIFSDEFKRQQFDIVTGTLFFHHFTEEQLVSFFKDLYARVKIGIVINDIHRHWFAYYSIKWLTRWFSKSSMVIHDAPLSVERAFKKSELLSILEKAGIKRYSIRWMWAFRWQVIVYAS
jgi:2-polyprenyl-3-methyl-5-hydroxy-6-metoxy-1,4-benzoquinol methylase